MLLLIQIETNGAPMIFKKLILFISLISATNAAHSTWGSRQVAAVIGIGSLIALYLWHSTPTDDDSESDPSDTTDSNFDIDEILYQNTPVTTGYSSDSDESDAHSITATSRPLEIASPLIFETRADSTDLPPVSFPFGWNTYPCFINNEATNSLHILPNSGESIKLLDDLNKFKVFYFGNTNQFLILKADAEGRVAQLFLYQDFSLKKEVNIHFSDGFPNLNQIDATQITHYGEQITIFTVDDRRINFSLNQ